MRLSRTSNSECLLVSALSEKLVHTKRETCRGKDVFHCLPGADEYQAALEACWHARLKNAWVYFVSDGVAHEIGPGDIPFQKRPDVVKGSLQ